MARSIIGLDRADSRCGVGRSNVFGEDDERGTEGGAIADRRMPSEFFTSSSSPAVCTFHNQADMALSS